MFMNMNFEWIASFPGRDNYCGFPGTFSEMSIVPRHVWRSISLLNISLILSLWGLKRPLFHSENSIIYCEILHTVALNDRGRSWSVTSGLSSDIRPRG